MLVLAALGFGAYHLYTTHDAHPTASPPAKVHSNSAVTAKTHADATATHKAAPAGVPRR